MYMYMYMYMYIYIYIYIYIGAAALQADPDNTFREPSATFIPLRRNSAFTVVKRITQQKPSAILPRTGNYQCFQTPSANLPRTVCKTFRDPSASHLYSIYQ